MLSLNVGPTLRNAVLGAILLSLAGCAVGAAQASAVTFAANCGHTGYLDYKPAYWSNGCTGGAFNVENLKWSRWTSESARAKGNMALRDPLCRPSCPEARSYRYQAAVGLSRPQTCRDENGTKRRYFSRVNVRVRWTAGNPFKKKPGWRTQKFVISPVGGCELSP